jgi:hypothetical protein
MNFISKFQYHDAPLMLLKLQLQNFEKAHLSTSLSRPHKPISHLLHIQLRRPQPIIQILLIHTPRIILAKRLINVPLLRLEHLLQAIPTGRPLGPIPNHLQDTALRVRGVKAGAGMRLHEPGVLDAIIGRGHADVPRGFLHDGGEDGAGVDARGG